MSNRLAPFLVMLIAFVVGCDRSPEAGSTPLPVLDEATRHIDSFGAHLGNITNFTVTTSAEQVAAGLGKFATSISSWSQEYVMLRAKMLAKGVGDSDEQQIARHYRGSCECFTLLFDHVERELRTRNDLSAFESDLKRVRESIQKLPP